MSTHSDLRRAEYAVIADAIELVVAENWTVATNDRRQNISRSRFISLAESLTKLQRLRQDLDGDAAHNKTQTSKLASKLPGRGSLRRDVLNCLLVAQAHLHGGSESGAFGMTTDAVENRLRKPHTSVSSAMNYLLNHGLVEDSGLRRDTRAGSPATVYAPTELARSLARQNLLVAP